jgi:hypothetical protein
MMGGGNVYPPEDGFCETGNGDWDGWAALGNEISEPGCLKVKCECSLFNVGECSVRPTWRDRYGCEIQVSIKDDSKPHVGWIPAGGSEFACGQMVECPEMTSSVRLAPDR